MSSEKRENAQNTEHNLKRAEEYLRTAETSSQGTGDKQLQQQVTKIREAVTETRKEIIKKLDNHTG